MEDAPTTFYTTNRRVNTSRKMTQQQQIEEWIVHVNVPTTYTTNRIVRMSESLVSYGHLEKN